MMYVVGIVVTALAILVSVAWHECGHMWAARATGMKVRRYFVGFGPTLWSTKKPNERGYTEYGVKAIPLGGFCDIAGMTPHDEIAPEDEKYAMYRQKPWKRIAVLFAGPAMNFVLGLVIIYGIANVWGLPNLHPSTTPVVSKTSCVAPETAPGTYADCTDPGPAAVAGMKPGDVIVKIGDRDVNSPDDVVAATRASSGLVPVVVERDGQRLTLDVNVQQTQRYTSKDAAEPTSVGAMGISAGTDPTPPAQYNPLSAVPATFAFTGDLAVELGKALVKIPTKIGALASSITGGERDPETPISVVGASRLGGEAVENDLWVIFWFLLAQLNFVLGAINLVPLLPFDGGHIAVATYEKLRNMLRKARGLLPAGPVDYLKLMPATYVVLAVVGAYMLLTVTADLVNPISLFQ
ncbi:M50 family metallopeptidase [Mycolicibacterium arenosum]|uniref:Zinc metalloprotease Rip1 n=1 Tax=Mycolicibacterium arenosum TaxID=2952157 RepID=A0ABT1MAN8_9MYCO|nr:M50 family metallopeptidase [Mycolicibacterium sp. CAU 1645]MCP9276233.1 M50 family metallopeptidase [Mycolicibacterium sp. CAU 1645]